jgi:excisionase family DNA binding protein
MTEERWLTVEDIVDMLKVHEQTVRRWLRAGQLRGVLLGRKAGYRVRESDLEAFLEARNAWTDEGKAVA